MILVALSKGYVAKISDEDARLSEFKWSAHVTRNGLVYAIRAVTLDDGRRTTSYMHREVLGLPPGRATKTDHKNGDTLDNQRENLRVRTNSQNCRNIEGARSHSKTGELGVHPVKRAGGARYVAQIRKDGVSHHLGSFGTVEAARAARLRAEREIWGVEPRRKSAHG